METLPTVHWDFTQRFPIFLLRYLLIPGGAFLLFYVWKRRQWFSRKIQQRFPRQQDILREVAYSLSTTLIFCVLTGLIFWAKRNNYTQMYTSVDEYGWVYFFLSILLMSFIHDTYFYWTHRLMHKPGIFKYVHKVHHLSHNPSPLAASAFHPLEAIVDFGIFPLIVFTIPVHIAAFGIFAFLGLLYNVMLHLGYELVPFHWHKHWLGKWQTTSTHHNMHHQFTKGNYGLYFNFWDQLMGTTHQLYEQRYQENATMTESDSPEIIRHS